MPFFLFLALASAGSMESNISSSSGEKKHPFFAVDGEESEVFDDGAQRLFVRPEGEGERLIVEFEHALFFRTKSL